LSSPFPYAGMTQFRFEGCALRPEFLFRPPPTTRPRSGGRGAACAARDSISSRRAPAPARGRRRGGGWRASTN